MNWAAISENVIAAVLGALALSFIYWSVGQYRNRKPVLWFELDSGFTQLDKNQHNSCVGYCVLVLKNRSRRLVRDIEVLFNSAVEIERLPSGVKAELQGDASEGQVKITVMQPRQELKLAVNATGREYLGVRKVFVGEQDMGDAVHFKLVDHLSLVVPFWVAVVVANLLFVSIITLSAEEIPSHQQRELSLSEGEPQ